MLTTLLVTAGTKVLGAFGQNKKNASATAGMQMRSGTVMEKKMTSSDTESVEMTDEG